MVSTAARASQNCLNVASSHMAEIENGNGKLIVLPKPQHLLRAKPAKATHNASQSLSVIVILSFLWKAQYIRQQMICGNSPFSIAIRISPYYKRALNWLSSVNQASQYRGK